MVVMVRRVSSVSHPGETLSVEESEVSVPLLSGISHSGVARSSESENRVSSVSVSEISSFVTTGKGSLKKIGSSVAPTWFRSKNIRVSRENTFFMTRDTDS